MDNNNQKQQPRHGETHAEVEENEAVYERIGWS